MGLNNTANSKRIFIAAEGGKLYGYNLINDNIELIFTDKSKETLMGLTKKGHYFFVGAKTRIFKFDLELDQDFNSFISSKMYINKRISLSHGLFKKKSPDFHQMDIFNEELFVTATGVNEIWKFDLNLKLKKRYNVKPPKKFWPVRYKRNYNHLNNVFLHDDYYYICLNWLTSKQYGPSGIVVLNTKMKEIKRFEYGWEAHNFSIIENKEYVLCGSSGAIKKVNHPHKAGLMVDRELVFKHNPSLYFCKDFSVDDNFIYIVGGSVNKREERNMSDGVIFILDKNFNLIKKNVFKNSGGFCGCLLNNLDYTKS